MRLWQFERRPHRPRRPARGGKEIGVVGQEREVYRIAMTLNLASGQSLAKDLLGDRVSFLVRYLSAQVVFATTLGLAAYIALRK